MKRKNLRNDSSSETNNPLTQSESIWEAAVNGHWDTVIQWIEREPSLMDVRGDGEFGKYRYRELHLLHLTAAKTSDMEVLQFLISKGCDPNVKDADGLTPLHHAAGWNSPVEMLKSLISFGADVHAKDCYGAGLSMCTKTYPDYLLFPDSAKNGTLTALSQAQCFPSVSKRYT